MTNLKVYLAVLATIVSAYACADSSEEKSERDYINQSRTALHCQEKEAISREYLSGYIKEAPNDPDAVYSLSEMVVCDGGITGSGFVREDASLPLHIGLGFISTERQSITYRIYVFINEVDVTDNVVSGHYIRTNPREPNYLPIYIENPPEYGFRVVIAMVDVMSANSPSSLFNSFATQHIFLSKSGNPPKIAESIVDGMPALHDPEPNYIDYKNGQAGESSITVVPDFIPYASLALFDMDRNQRVSLRCDESNRDLIVFKPIHDKASLLKCKNDVDNDLLVENGVFLIMGNYYSSTAETNNVYWKAVRR